MYNKIEGEAESFRDRISTADTDGKRIWIYPIKPKGKIHNARMMVAYFLLFFFFAGPFIEINGQPLILIDILDRTFVIFGLIFKPQDLHLFVLAALGLLIFIVLFTAVFGRLFCGWTCPQTIFMEMVFRKIEYFIDGNAGKQRKLKKAPWGISKLLRKSSKHLIFYAISIIVCLYLMAYVIGVHDTLEVISRPSWYGSAGFFAMFVICFLFYGNFAWFREQACTIVCPYGRLQSVLIDSNSIIVAYDYSRGEPRNKISNRTADSNDGDCIDCEACVKVCPTGIDIRNGSQLECINCTACIDSCNFVMKKTKKPEGLIRYTSEYRLAGGQKFKFTGRILVYSVVLLTLLILTTGLLTARNPVEAIILRAPGSLYFDGPDNSIRNLYTIKLSNKTSDQIPVKLKLKTPTAGVITMVAGDILLMPEQVTETAFFVDIPRGQIYGQAIAIVIEVISRESAIDEVTTSFLAPENVTSNE